MASIYDRPVSQLLRDLIRERLKSADDVLTRQEAFAWFRQHYPKVKGGTVAAHLLKLATNEPTRVHYNAKAGDDDLLFKVQPGRYRLYEPKSDPSPIGVKPAVPGPSPTRDGTDEDEDSDGGEFAYERDLRNYLSKNLSRLEPGLRLYEEEGITGIEFPVGGRYIDILAVSPNNEYLVIELKVARGYDRVIGQLLRYMAWIEKYQAEPTQRVRGIIVARELSDDLLLASSRIPDISLFEYELQVQVRAVRHAERSSRHKQASGT